MIPKECKRLAEVDFPIAEVSRHAMREKSIRHGHPSTLHLWWARRPLAACRAVLLALLLPDPKDPYCPEDFKEKTRDLLSLVQQVGDGTEGLREGLLKFIGDFANWDLASNTRYLEVARGLVGAAYPEDTPLVVDPFAGGGSIPLEALRLGCEAFASDLNPVASLIQKVLLEDIPRYGQQKIKFKKLDGEEIEADGLAEALRITGAEIDQRAKQGLAEFYPPDPDDVQPIAYLWARTVRCEAPNCGAEIPLMRSFWLCKKANKRKALKYKVIKIQKDTSLDENCKLFIEFEIVEPKSGSDIPEGTVTRARATCLCCGAVLPPERVRKQLSAQNGGADVIFDEQGKRIGGARLLAVVTLHPNEIGRQYRLPIENDYQVVWRAYNELSKIVAKSPPNDLRPVPDEPTPWKNGHRSVGAPRIYGMTEWGQLFTFRQNNSLIFYVKLIRDVFSSQNQVARTLSMAFSKLIELSNADSWWEPVAECPRTIYGRHDLPATWDFAEGVPISNSSGSFAQVLENLYNNLSIIGSNWDVGQVEQADACNHPLPDSTANLWFTDPPYYDAVAYSDLSDLFYAWLKRTNPEFNRLPVTDPNSVLTPKINELTVTTVASETDSPKTRASFEIGIAKAFTEGHRTLSENGLGCVVFAHKTTEGWEAFLNGLLLAGWVVIASWPIKTEQGYRLNARDNASLATSVHLVCRPKPEDAPIGDWSFVSRELPKRVREWMERLQGEKVRGADLVFACIGPALEIYSRYSKVVDAQDREIPLGGDPEAKEPYQRGYLAYVWEVVGRMALEQVLGTQDGQARDGGPEALEEDSRLTALFLWTRQTTGNGDQGVKGAKVQRNLEEEGLEEEIADEEEDTPKKKVSGGYSLPFDVVRRFAQPLGIHLPDWEGRIIETEKGVVRLLTVTERAKKLFGEKGAEGVATEMERSPSGVVQLSLFSDLEAAPNIRPAGRSRIEKNISDEALRTHREATTLDRVHAAMLLQKSGRTNALRALLRTEVEHGSEFLRLANALSALYPKESEEKRLLDAMLLSVGR